MNVCLASTSEWSGAVKTLLSVSVDTTQSATRWNHKHTLLFTVLCLIIRRLILRLSILSQRILSDSLSRTTKSQQVSVSDSLRISKNTPTWFPVLSVKVSVKKTREFTLHSLLELVFSLLWISSPLLQEKLSHAIRRGLAQKRSTVQQIWRFVSSSCSMSHS
jgi:hypothetical protein